MPPSPTGRPVTKKQRRRLAQQGPVKVLRPWWQQPWVLTGGGAAVVVAVVIIAVLVFTSSSAPAYTVSTPTAVPSSVLSAVTAPPVSLFGSVGEGGSSGYLNRLGSTATVKNSAGLPEVVYVGAEYCPYCAAERWPLIMALSRFGTFTGLKEMSSSNTDVFPDTSSFTFVDSAYTSQYISFSATEAVDRDGNALQTPTSAVQDLFNTYDYSPYSSGAGGYPFLDIAGEFVLAQTSFSPQILQGLSWSQIAADLSDPSSSVTAAIVGTANYLTAAICNADGDQPSSVCGSSVVQSISTNIMAESTVGG